MIRPASSDCAVGWKEYRNVSASIISLLKQSISSSTYWASMDADGLIPAQRYYRWKAESANGYDSINHGQKVEFLVFFPFSLFPFFCNFSEPKIILPSQEMLDSLFLFQMNIHSNEDSLTL